MLKMGQDKLENHPHSPSGFGLTQDGQLSLRFIFKSLHSRPFLIIHMVGIFELIQASFKPSCPNARRGGRPDN